MCWISRESNTYIHTIATLLYGHNVQLMVMEAYKHVKNLKITCIEAARILTCSKFTCARFEVLVRPTPSPCWDPSSCCCCCCWCCCCCKGPWPFGEGIRYWRKAPAGLLSSSLLFLLSMTMDVHVLVCLIDHKLSVYVCLWGHKCKCPPQAFRMLKM